MAIFFLDSSAIAKAYIVEQGSVWIRSLLNPGAGNELNVSVVAGAEVISAIIRRRRTGSLDAIASAAAIQEFRDDWQFLYNHVAIDEQLIERAMSLVERYELRAYDSVQLAAALTLHDRCRSVGINIALVSADTELNTVATAEGLHVENPNLHP